ncbi:MAG: LamG domain-containing protein [Pirellulales bacterium]|nr:LamG domain-containing protein [Pirellulales bacterium]
MLRSAVMMMCNAAFWWMTSIGGAQETGLLLSFSFDEGREAKELTDGSRIRDLSGRGHDGVIRGEPAWISGKFGFGIRLTEGDYIEIAASPDFDDMTALSVDGWFWPEDVQTDLQILASKWDHPDARSFILYGKPDGIVEWGVGWTKQDYLILRDVCPFAADQWQHIAATWEGASGALRLYRGGKLVQEAKTPSQIQLVNSSVPLLIGAQNADPGAMHAFAGAIGRVRLWKRALSAEEIQTTFDREKDLFSGPLSVRQAVRPEAAAPVHVGSDKHLFLDDHLIDSANGAALTTNRPELTGEISLVAEKPWEMGTVHPFGDSVLQEDDGSCRMYYPSYDKKGRLWFCMATSRDGIRWERPELDIVPYEGIPKTNILYPDASCPKMAYFFGTCVFKDTRPGCPPDQRYKMINGDAETWVFGSPDGLRFRPLFDRPSFRPSDTNNILFFDDRIGQYVAYMRVYSPWRKVVRCVTSDLANFGRQRVVFGYDQEDLAKVDKSRFVRMDFYNSSAIRYPYAADAYLMFPSAYYHFPDPPVGKFANDGITDIQLAASRDGIRWTRISREPWIPLQEGQNGLYMASGMIRRGDRLFLYYGVYHPTHGAGIDPRDYITRAVLRLDGFVSLDAPSQATVTTVPLVFSGSHLELNVVAEKARVALLDENRQAIEGYGLDDCDPITGDHIAKTVTWHGGGDLSRLRGRNVRLQFEISKGKLFAFQFAREVAVQE